MSEERRRRQEATGEEGLEGEVREAQRRIQEVMLAMQASIAAQLTAFPADPVIAALYKQFEASLSSGGTDIVQLTIHQPPQSSSAIVVYGDHNVVNLSEGVKAEIAFPAISLPVIGDLIGQYADKRIAEETALLRQQTVDLVGQLIEKRRKEKLRIFAKQVINLAVRENISAKEAVTRITEADAAAIAEFEELKGESALAESVVLEEVRSASDYASRRLLVAADLLRLLEGKPTKHTVTINNSQGVTIRSVVIGDMIRPDRYYNLVDKTVPFALRGNNLPVTQERRAITFPPAFTYFGFSLLLYSLGVILVSWFAPFQRLVYSTPDNPAPSPLANPSLWVILLGSLLAAFVATRQRTALRGALSVVAVVAVSLGVLLSLTWPPRVASAAELSQAAPTAAPPTSQPPPATAAPTTVPAPPYRAEIVVKGPDTLRFGTSATIVLTASVAPNLEPAPRIALTAADGYSATVRLQLPNLEIQEGLEATQDAQPLSVASPAVWPLVVTPKEKRLGGQSLVFSVVILDRTGTRIGAPFSEVRIDVTDPIGLPAGAVYVLGAIGAVLLVPLAIAYFTERVAKRREAAQTRPQAPPQPQPPEAPPQPQPPIQQRPAPAARARVPARANGLVAGGSSDGASTEPAPAPAASRPSSDGAATVPAGGVPESAPAAAARPKRTPNKKPSPPGQAP